jgi:hypothetical protein
VRGAGLEAGDILEYSGQKDWGGVGGRNGLEGTIRNEEGLPTPQRRQPSPVGGQDLPTATSTRAALLGDQGLLSRPLA